MPRPLAVMAVRRIQAVFVAGLVLGASGVIGTGTAVAAETGEWPLMPVENTHQVGVCHVPPTSEVPEREMGKGTPRMAVGYPAGVAPSPGSDAKVHVALGDSFAAGEGAPSPDSCGDDAFVDGTATEGNHCHRSPDAYPVQMWRILEGRDPGWSLDFRACSGATSAKFEDRQGWDDTPGPWNAGEDRANPPQWASDPATGNPENRDTTRDADLVTVTMTGNDIGFADIVKDCVKDIYTGRIVDSGVPLGPINKGALRRIGNCSPDRDTDIAEKRTEIVDRLTRTYSSVLDRLRPGGQLLVAGYPRPFPAADRLPGGCGVGAGATILRDEMDWLNSVADQANDIVRESVANAAGGATYVDVSDILQVGDHTLCSDAAGPGDGQRWINRVIPSHMEWSIHPNAHMHAAEAARMIDCYDMMTTGGPASSRCITSI